MTARSSAARLRSVRVAVSLAVVAALLIATAAAASASSPIVGGGSGFAAPEIDQWKADTAVVPYSLGINYVAQGSSFGRQSFTQSSLDFGATDIVYPPAEVPALQSGRCAGKALADCFVYVPVSAGGLGLMYNLIDGNGNRVTNLKLTRREACKIFTGAISTWNAPELVATDPFLAGFSRQIRPVIRADGAGESYVLSQFCIAVAPDVWQAFIADRIAHDSANTAEDFKSGQPVSNWPQNWGLSNSVAFADGVANVVASPDIGSDTITYDATAYAVQRGFPVASLQNAAGVFTQPEELNVTVALAYATPNTSAIAQGTFNLNFSGPDPRAYFPSTYSYLLAQTAGFDAGKGATLAQFLCYAVSKGQADAIPLKYARLSSQIEKISIDAIVRIPGSPSAANCPVAGAPPPPPPPVVEGGGGGGSGGGGTSGDGGTGGGGGANGGGTGGPGGVGGATGPGAKNGGRVGSARRGGGRSGGTGADGALTPSTVNLESKLTAAAAGARPANGSTPTALLLFFGAGAAGIATEIMARRRRPA